MICSVAPALVLLHGFTHTGRSWDGVARALPERYRPHAPDLRGHGRAAGTMPVRLEAVVSDLDRLAAGERLALAGYSMGGRIALQYALARPARVTRLVLIGASPGIADPTERAARVRADEHLAGEIERMSIEAFAARWARTPVLADQPAEIAARAQADRLCNTPQGLARALRGLGAGALPPLWHRLGELEIPVLLIVGERDQKFLAIARAMADDIPSARLRTIPGAGHAAHLERPEAVAEVIAQE
jgi:2-succinyl-6-hydroxy-2,4-cyclohexadiene-1-carboxylate synthase